MSYCLMKSSHNISVMDDEIKHGRCIRHCAALKQQHQYIGNDVWKVIQNGNSKKRISTGKDGIVRILSPVTAAEIQAVEKEQEEAVFKQQFEAFKYQFRRVRKRDMTDSNITFSVGSLGVNYYSSFAKQSEDWDLLHEDLEQIDDLDIEEMDINGR
ncbi:hypothetical protein Tco_0921141 [Tanacetum coccineum]